MSKLAGQSGRKGAEHNDDLDHYYALRASDCSGTFDKLV